MNAVKNSSWSGYSRFSCSSKNPDRVASSDRGRVLGPHLALMMDGESSGLSQAANWEAWNKRRAAESTELFITAATAVFLSKYGLYVQRKTAFPVCMKMSDCCCCVCTLRKHMVKIKLPHRHFLSNFFSVSSKFKGDEMTLTHNTIMHSYTICI